MHYWSKEFLAPISIIALYDKSLNALNVSLVCDLPTISSTDYRVTLNTHRWFDLLPKHTKTWPVILVSSSNRNIIIKKKSAKLLMLNQKVMKFCD